MTFNRQQYVSLQIVGYHPSIDRTCDHTDIACDNCDILLCFYDYYYLLENIPFEHGRLSLRSSCTFSPHALLANRMLRVTGLIGVSGQPKRHTDSGDGCRVQDWKGTSPF